MRLQDISVLRDDQFFPVHGHGDAAVTAVFPDVSVDQDLGELSVPVAEHQGQAVDLLFDAEFGLRLLGKDPLHEGEDLFL